MISQGHIVAESLAEYLKRHPEIESRCSQQGRRSFYSSEKAHIFDKLAAIFYGKKVRCCEMS
jgi:glutamate racemase